MKKKKKRKKTLVPVLIVIIAIVIAIAIYLLCGMSLKLEITEYTVKSDKIKGEITIAHLSDLHCAEYGKGQQELVDAVKKYSPDFVAMSGDMADKRYDSSPAFVLTKALAADYPVYFCIGNHENAYKGSVKKIRNEFEEAGAVTLHGTGDRITVGENELLVCGVDDPMCAPDYNLRMWENQLEDCKEMLESGVFSVLLSHRPECVGDYADSGFDLVLSGHAHGGQVRIPGLINGVYAPHQGYFPKYAGGCYFLSGNTSLIVSRGLAKNILPRVYNRPEIVIIHIVGES